MIIHLQKDFDGKWKPFEEADIELSDSIAPGEIRLFKFSRKRSTKENATFWSFLNAVYKQQEKFDNFQSFLTEILYRAGHGDIEYLFIDGQKILKFKPKSLSFAITKHEEFHELFNKVCGIVYEIYQIEFEDWKQNKELNKCENPNCNSKIAYTHNIFPREDICLENGWVVNICHRCRNASLGINLPENKIAITRQKMEYMWCQVKSINYKQALKKIYK